MKTTVGTSSKSRRRNVEFNRRLSAKLGCVRAVTVSSVVKSPRLHADIETGRQRRTTGLGHRLPIDRSVFADACELACTVTGDHVVAFDVHADTAAQSSGLVIVVDIIIIIIIVVVSLLSTTSIIHNARQRLVFVFQCL